MAAEVRGRATIHDDADWLRAQVNAVTDHFEEGLDPRWWVADAPEEYIERQLRAIVGVEVAVTSIEGKSKLETAPGSTTTPCATPGRRVAAERNVAARMGE